ncbi:MAG: elongation factor Ts [Prevotella sp.]|nr:elongation factor Ts [Prevotella sp.]
MAYKPTMEDIKKLRAITGAGLADVKKALVEAEGDFEKAKDLLRERGLAIAAKRSDRETSNGCVLVKVEKDFAAIIALKCETDFVANGADFIALTQAILDAAVANKCQSIEEVAALTLPDGQVVSDAITQRSGITGEKMELDGYNFLEGENIYHYNHQGKNILCTLVQLNKGFEEQGKKLALQVASMNPISLDEASVPQSVKDSEFQIAIQKTKDEQVEKAVEVALKKAGINPNLVDSEDHIKSNIAKGWLTEEEAEKARTVKEETAAAKAADLNEQMIQNIAKGRLAKFFKENCLVNQEVIMHEPKENVAAYLKAADKELKVVAFKRFTLRAD